MDDVISKVFGRKGCVVLATILIAVVLIGEVIVITSDRTSYGADVVFSNGSAEYSVSISGSDVYDVVLLDRNGSTPVTSLAIFVDERYDEFADQAEGLRYYIDSAHMAQQISLALSNRGFDAVTECNSSGLLSFLEQTISNPSGYGLIVTSFALPSSVYTGDLGDLLLRWIQAGGTLYWVGSEVGRYFINGDSLVEVENSSVLLFGTDCINENGPRYAESVVDNKFTEALTLSGNDLLYALDVSDIPGALSMGYQADGYSTISMVPYGSGEICVFSGDFDIDLIDDMGQVITSGVSCKTTIIDHRRGEAARETVWGVFESTDEDSTVFIYVGGMYVRFAEVFHA